MNKGYFSMEFIKICTDLIAFEPNTIILPAIPGGEIQDVQQKFNYLYQQVQRTIRMKNHHYALYYAYYLGKLIEQNTISRRQKQLFKSQMTLYYAQGVERTFLLFEFYGIEQIFRTKYLTLRVIRNIKSADFKRLFSVDFAGAQILEGESVNM